MGPFSWNTKCFVQGFILLFVWLLAANGLLPVDGRISAFSTWAFALGLFVVTYWVNAVLDVKYGCDHGEILKQVASSL
jgi:hypothetical protein